MSRATKTVGVIGGLGPAATLDFFDRILKRTKASADQDHLRLIIDNNTKAPDRNAFMRGEGPSPVPALVASARGLETAGAEFVVMACNTTHAWEPEIRAALKIPFISMPAETVAAVAGLRAKKAGVLAVDGCLRADIYQAQLKAKGVEPVLLPADSQRSFMDVVYRIKSGDVGATSQRVMQTLAGKLVAAGAEVVIAGCTEVPLVLGADDVEAELINSTDVLVERTIVFAGGELR